jgi:hypothetical protein
MARTEQDRWKRMYGGSWAGGGVVGEYTHPTCYVFIRSQPTLRDYGYRFW